MPTGLLPHPVTGALFESPVPAGTGWPGDPAEAQTLRCTDAAQVSSVSRGVPDLRTLDAVVSTCAACPRLVSWREEVARGKRAAYAGEPYWGRAVPSFGEERPRLLVVGLAPAAHGANRTGRMFTGDRSGEVLFAALHRAGLASQESGRAAGDGLELSGVRITASVHCAPPGNLPTPEERHTCGFWLDRELTLLEESVEVVLALGRIGWDAALKAARRRGWQVPRGAAGSFGHGAEVFLQPPRREPVRLLGSYHVSQQNTFTGRLTPQMLDAVLSAAVGDTPAASN